MANCENCGVFVTEQFAQTFGDNAGTVHACPECKGMTAVKRGAGANPDYEPRSANVR
ncbi:DUF7563 family protein [Halorussus litoreus]|uniref:DUF7563 family protein n=1 Tax=Halorussus litoreus TaxID=1710536 RepID=UPI0018E59FB2|nr:hypothetical protein [Halorussus litoreus]